MAKYMNLEIKDPHSLFHLSVTGLPLTPATSRFVTQVIDILNDRPAKATPPKFTIPNPYESTVGGYYQHAGIKYVCVETKVGRDRIRTWEKEND